MEKDQEMEAEQTVTPQTLVASHKCICLRWGADGRTSTSNRKREGFFHYVVDRSVSSTTPAIPSSTAATAYPLRLLTGTLFGRGGGCHP